MSDTVLRCVMTRAFLDGGWHPQTATLAYDSDHPWTVEVTFINPDGKTVWLMSREVLAWGMTDIAGYMDSIVSPRGTNGIEFQLTSPFDAWGDKGECDTTTFILFQRRDIEAFINFTYTLVPVGTEMDGHDVDSEIEQMLNA